MQPQQLHRVSIPTTVLCCLAIFAWQLYALNVAVPARGDFYFQPSLPSPLLELIKSWLFLLAFVGMFSWLGVCGLSSSWPGRIGGLAFFAFGLSQPAIGPSGLWCTALISWIFFALEGPQIRSGLFVGVLLTWTFADSSSIFLFPILVFLALGAILDGKLPRSRLLIGFSALSLLAYWIHLPYVLASWAAYHESANSILGTLGWSTPNFQDEPKLVVAIVLLFVSGHVLRPLSWEKILLSCGAFLLLLFQDRSQAVLISIAASLFAEAIHQRLPSRWFVTLEQPTTVTMAFTALSAIFGAVLIGLQQHHQGPYQLQSLRAALSVPELRDADCRLFHDVKYGEDLAAFGLPRCLEPDFQGRAQSSISFHEYETLIGLKPGWEQVLKHRKPAFALLLRDSSLTGILLEREHWRIRAVTAPVTYMDRGLPRSLR